MGHERIGLLPKNKKWNRIVEQIGGISESKSDIAEIATQTLMNVRTRYEALWADSTVTSTFQFLVIFAAAFRQSNPREYMSAHGMKFPAEASLLSLVRALRNKVGASASATEYGQIATSAAADALSQWHGRHRTNQLSLLEPSDKFLESWQQVGQGGGFCELSRLYFAKLTERYLNYYLERNASAALPTVDRREKFQKDIGAHVDEISRHAFETAKITESFAAGWFNKNAGEGAPDDAKIAGFLHHAFGKLRDELRLEEQRI